MSIPVFFATTITSFTTTTTIAKSPMVVSKYANSSIPHHPLPLMGQRKVIRKENDGFRIFHGIIGVVHHYHYLRPQP